MGRARTRAKRVISPFELFAGCKVVPLGCYALEVIGVVLVAVLHI